MYTAYTIGFDECYNSWKSSWTVWLITKLLLRRWSHNRKIKMAQNGGRVQIIDFDVESGLN